MVRTTNTRSGIPTTQKQPVLSPPPNALDDDTQYEATIVTSDGSMTFELYANEAPLAVNNFVSLSRDGFTMDSRSTVSLKDSWHKAETQLG